MNISDDTYEKSYTYLYGCKVCNKNLNLYSIYFDPLSYVLTLYRGKLKILKIPYK